MAYRLRIFVTTSHISCVYMALHAQRTAAPHDKDVLLVDIGTRRKEVIDSIRAAATMHQWALVHSFSGEVDDNHRFEPTLKKKLTRRWKELPIIRNIYSWLLLRYEQQRDAELNARMLALLPELKREQSIEVFGHTQTHLNNLITRMQPSARTFYFEHGLGDYHYITHGGRLLAPLFALFADAFRHCLIRQGITPDQVHELSVPPEFPALAARQLEIMAFSGNKASLQPDKPIVLILLEAVDMYEVPTSFWGAYIDHILSALPEPGRYHFLLKPHPVASSSSLKTTVAHCSKRGIDFTLLDEPWQKSIAAEILFAQWAERTEHVFCLFSSACFYLSQLYRDPRITYHYSTDFMDRWTDNAPPMYKRHFEGLKPLIKEVFSERCQPY